MKKGCSFLIVCLTLFTACHTPRQVVLEKTVTIRDTIKVETIVPASVGEAVETFPIESSVDSFYLENSAAYVQVVMRVDTVYKVRRYAVKYGRKVDTIYQEVPVVLTDTIRIDCPPTLPSMPTDGKFPWWWVLAAMGALMVWWVGKKKKR